MPSYIGNENIKITSAVGIFRNVKIKITKNAKISKCDQFYSNYFWPKRFWELVDEQILLSK